jgi:hypothetical protein
MEGPKNDGRKEERETGVKGRHLALAGRGSGAVEEEEERTRGARSE